MDLSPRPFNGLLEPHHRDGSMVLDASRNLGYLKDLTPYGATFQPLDLRGYQKEKAMLYISLRDAYERLYSHETENHTEHKPQRGYLNTYYDEFVMRYGNLNARQNVKLVMMDAGGRDILRWNVRRTASLSRRTSSTVPFPFRRKRLSRWSRPKKPCPPRSTCTAA